MAEGQITEPKPSFTIPTIPQRIDRASLWLQQGQPFQALQELADLPGPHPRAVRSIALAQLGEYDRAKRGLQESLSEFERRGEALASARARAALAEIAFAQRDLAHALEALSSDMLRKMGDQVSAAYVEIQRARIHSLLGQTAEAALCLERAGDGPAAELARAEGLACQGRFALAVESASRISPENPLLHREGRRLLRDLTDKAFVLRRAGEDRQVTLLEVETFQFEYVDTIRRRFSKLDLSRKTNQLQLLLSLAGDGLSARGFYGRTSESLEMRIRTEVSRIRKLTGLEIEPTAAGYRSPGLAVLLPRVKPTADPVLAVLADGCDWPPRAIALMLGLSVRSVERRLETLDEVEASGQGKARRYRIKNPEWASSALLLLMSKAYQSVGNRDRVVTGEREQPRVELDSGKGRNKKC